MRMIFCLFQQFLPVAMTTRISSMILRLWGRMQSKAMTKPEKPLEVLAGAQFQW